MDKMLGDIDAMKAGDVLVVDEAGLIGAKLMSDLLTKANDRGIRLFMLGDNLQIPPAMAGNGFDELLAKKNELGIKTTELNIVLRQKDPAEAKWTLDIRAGNPDHAGDAGKDATLRALNGYAQRYYTGFDENGRALYRDVKAGEAAPENATPGLQFLDDANARLIDDYIGFRRKYPKVSAVVMATTNKAADALGRDLRKKMIENGLIHDVRRFANTEIGVGDTVMLTATAGLPVMKKENGSCVPAKSDDITSGDQLDVVGFEEKTGRCVFKKGRDEFSCDAEAFAERARNGLVLPLYEAQGVSRDRAFMAVSEAEHMDKVYAGVAFSRHEQQMSAYVSRAAYPEGIEGLAKEMRVFSTRQQLYSDNKSVPQILETPHLPDLHSLLRNSSESKKDIKGFETSSVIKNIRNKFQNKGR